VENALDDIGDDCASAVVGIVGNCACSEGSPA
jgi:hypothetical protein